MSQLRLRIAEGEGSMLDFKFRIDDQKKIARTLVAFANTYGGSLLIGVKDNGKVAGTNPEEEYFMIEGAADLHTKPRVAFESAVWQEGHHLVLEIIVPKSSQKHKAKDENDLWKPYVRVDDHTVLGNKILSKVWHMEHAGTQRPETFDEETMEFLHLIEELQPVSLSKLYRKSTLGLKKVDSVLAVLVYWKVIEMVISESGTNYRLKE